MGKSKWAYVLALPAVLLASVAAGCGSSGTDQSAGASPGTNASAGGDSKVLAQAAKTVETAMTGSGEFPKPTESFDPGNGKLAIIPCGLAGKECADGAKVAVEATKAMGWTPSPIFDGEFNPQKQAGFVDQAVQQSYDGIVLVSIDVNSIKAAVDRALAKKIPIACIMCYSVGYEDKLFDPRVDFAAEGELQAWWLIHRSKGKGKILIFEDKAYPATIVRTDAVEKVIKENCPDCSLKRVSFPTTDLQKPGPPSFTAALSANPKGTLTDIVDPYDVPAQAMLKTLEQSGRSEVTLDGWDGGHEMVAALAAKNPHAGATTGIPWDYASWAGVDLVARAKAGKEPWKGYDTLPDVLITSDNAAKYEGEFYGPAEDIKSIFEQVWKPAS
jgi:ribose transport system substrate-binding protein